MEESRANYVVQGDINIAFNISMDRVMSQLGLLEECVNRLKEICGKLKEYTHCESVLRVSSQELRDLKLEIRTVREVFQEQSNANVTNPKRQKRNIFGYNKEAEVEKKTEILNALIVQMENVTDEQAKLANHTYNSNEMDENYDEFRSVATNIYEDISSFVLKLRKIVYAEELEEIFDILPLEYIERTCYGSDEAKSLLHDSRIPGEIFVNEIVFLRSVNIKTEIKLNNLHIEISIPVVRKLPFIKYRAIGTPIKVDGHWLTIKPSTEYLLTNQQFSELIPIERDTCKVVSDFSICAFPDLTTIEPSKSCELSILRKASMSEVMKTCDSYPSKAPSAISLNEMQSRYLIPVAEPRELKAECTREKAILNSTVVLNLVGKCKYIYNGQELMRTMHDSHTLNRQLAGFNISGDQIVSPIDLVTNSRINMTGAAPDFNAPRERLSDDESNDEFDADKFMTTLQHNYVSLAVTLILISAVILILRRYCTCGGNNAETCCGGNAYEVVKTK